MIQDCPRCGFVQPKDKYCASCGLNIETYRPQQKPFYQKIVKSPQFLFSFFAIFMLALFGLTHLQQPNESTNLNIGVQNFKKRQVASSEKRTQPNSLQETNVSDSEESVGPIVQASLQQTSNSETSNTETQNKNQTVASTTSTSSSDVPSSSTTSSSTQTPTAPPPAEEKKNFEQIHIQFAEVPKTSLENFYHDSSKLQDSLDEKIIAATSTQSLPEIHSSLSGLLLLPGESTLALEDQQPAIIHFSTPHPSGDPVEEPIGFRLQMRTLASTKDDISLEIESLLRLLSENDTPFSSEIRETYQFKPSSEILILSGLLPQDRNLAQNADLHLLSSTPLSLLGSEDFLTNIKDLVVLIQVR